MCTTKYSLMHASMNAVIHP